MSKKNKEIDHTNTDEMVCPYCGHTHSDSWELVYDSETTECNACDTEFRYEREKIYSYSTSKI